MNLKLESIILFHLYKGQQHLGSGSTPQCWVVDGSVPVTIRGENVLSIGKSHTLVIALCFPEYRWNSNDIKLNRGW